MSLDGLVYLWSCLMFCFVLFFAVFGFAAARPVESCRIFRFDKQWCGRASRSLEFIVGLDVRGWWFDVRSTNVIGSSLNEALNSFI